MGNKPPDFSPRGAVIPKVVCTFIIVVAGPRGRWKKTLRLGACCFDEIICRSRAALVKQPQRAVDHVRGPRCEPEEGNFRPWRTAGLLRRLVPAMTAR